jgi:hypothetical protein
VRTARLAALLLGAMAATAAADEPRPSEPLPAGRLLAVVSARTGTGALYNSLGVGWGIGLEAGYAPLRSPQTVGLGLSWSIAWSSYGSGSARIADSLSMVELDAGARMRLMLGTRRRSVLWIGGGAALVRTNEPLFTTGDRSYVGPWGAVGLESLVLGLLVTPSLRFGDIDGGRGTLSLSLAIGSGR